MRDKLTQCALGVINPVGREEPAESRDEVHTTVVGDRLCDGINLLGAGNDAKVVLQEGDACAADCNAAFERIGRLRALAKVVRHRRQQAVLGNDRLGADIVEQEAAGAVGVLGLAGTEAALADQGGRLVAEAAGDGDALEGTGAEGAEGGGVRGGDDLGECQLGAVELEEGEEGVVVLACADVHEHCAAGVGRVGHEHRRAVGPLRAAVEAIYQPRVDSAKRQTAFLVGRLDCLNVVQQPQQLDARRVRGKGEATQVEELVGAVAGLELAD